MASKELKKNTLEQIDKAVSKFDATREEFELLAKNLRETLAESRKLRQFIHSTKLRVKDPEHLRDRLKRLAFEVLQKNKPFDVTEDNLFSRIDDLAGVRLLHLHTKQMKEMHPAIIGILEEHRFGRVRKPVAYTWDIETEKLFKDIGIRVVQRDTMYTSVHYVVQANRRTKMRAEIQVRTLMEEVWGEVSHTINYPHKTTSIVCAEQLKVLARVASGCTRLVDSIFVSYYEHKKSEKE